MAPPARRSSVPPNGAATDSETIELGGAAVGEDHAQQALLAVAERGRRRHRRRHPPGVAHVDGVEQRAQRRAVGRPLRADPWPRGAPPAHRSPATHLVRSSRTRGASSSRILASTAIALSPAKAACPVRHSKSTQPSEKTSARGPHVAIAARLLGRHVAGRADDHAGARRAACAREARDAEVEQLDAVDRVAVGQEQVARLDVAMHHAVRVRLRQRPRRRARRARSLSATVSPARRRRAASGSPSSHSIAR